MIVEVTLKNVSEIPGKEIVQLYVRDIVGEFTRPIKEIKGFKKIQLNPMESKKLRFELPFNNLGFHGLEMKYIVEPGEFNVWVGPNSSEGLEGNFTVQDSFIE